MRRSFGNSGGSGSGSGGFLRAVERTMGARPTRPPSSGTNMFSLAAAKDTSTVTNTLANYVSVGGGGVAGGGGGGNNGLYSNATLSSTWQSSSSFYSEYDDHEWDWVDQGGDEVEGNGNDNDRDIGRFVFGSVPSVDEVESAVSAIQHVLAPASYVQFLEEGSSSGSEMDWLEPSLYLFNQGMMPSRRTEKVYDAFHMLQTEPAIQRMVVSLSSDKAVWDAVLNNEVVRELRSSYAAETDKYNGPDKDSNATKSILMSILDSTKEKVMELIETITKFVNEVFQPSQAEKEPSTSSATIPLEKAIRSSLMLSVIVLLVVIVTRAVKP